MGEKRKEESNGVREGDTHKMLVSLGKLFCFCGRKTCWEAKFQVLFFIFGEVSLYFCCIGSIPGLQFPGL